MLVLHLDAKGRFALAVCSLLTDCDSACQQDDWQQV
jgi:hypothetical protein